MPVTHVHIEWPDQKADQIYSPSSIIKEYFKPAEELAMADFLTACTESLNQASQRVEKKFGFECTSASAELQRVEFLSRAYDHSSKVKIISIQ